jgi:hypothetical protein
MEMMTRGRAGTGPASAGRRWLRVAPRWGALDVEVWNVCGWRGVRSVVEDEIQATRGHRRDKVQLPAPPAAPPPEAAAVNPYGAQRAELASAVCPAGTDSAAGTGSAALWKAPKSGTEGGG